MPDTGHQRLLLCHVGFVEIGGSEMVVLELIEWFTDRGWRVDLFTTAFGGPMASEMAGLVESGSLRVLGLGRADVDGVEPDPRAADYDLIWVNHSLIPSSIVARLQTEPIETPIVWHHMSSVLPLEMPLLYGVENAISSIITCVSPLARDRIVAFGFDSHDVELFDNPVPDRFITVAGRSDTARLASLLIVSNHPPSELLEAARVLRERGLDVQVAGRDGTYRRLAPSDIDAVDAVVTIGKTTQYALVMGVPVYSYDHVGGGGWITEENVDREHYGNFSGRIDERVLTAAQLVDEIVGGYERARAFAHAYRPTAAHRWSLTRQLDTLVADERLRPRPRALAPVEVQHALLLCAHRDELWAALRDAHREVVRGRERIDALLSSRSWRWTAPLRRLRSWFPRGGS